MLFEMSIIRRFPFLATNFAKWVLLVSFASYFGTAIATIERKYELFDQLDIPTSIPFINGKIRIECYGIESDENKTNFNLINETARSLNNEYSMKIGEKYQLNSDLIGNRYTCEGSDYAIVIRDLQCNPFALKPEISCTNDELCLVGKDGKPRCKEKQQIFCRLNEYAEERDNTYSLPKLHFACNKDKTTESYGSCRAVKLNRVVVALTDDENSCPKVGVLSLNSIELKPDKVLLMPFNNITWNLTYSTKVQISCKLMDERNVIYINDKFASVASIDSKLSSESQVPKKLKLTCLVNEDSTKMHLSHSTFLIIYDADPPHRYAVITKSQHTNEILSLKCSCSAPAVFPCGLSWKPPRTVEKWKIKSGSSNETVWLEKINDMGLTMKPQQLILYSWEHSKPRNYTCYTHVYASNFPNNFDLYEIPLAESVITETITISIKDFVIQENASTRTNSDKAGANAKANSNVSSTAKDSKSTVLITLVSGCFVTVFVLIVIVVFGIVKMRKISKKQEETDSLLSNTKGPKESNRRTTGSFSTDQKRQSSPVERKSTVAKKPIPRPSELTKVDSKFGLKARRN